MTIGEAIVKRIDELLFERGWSLYKLAKESCLPLSTLKNLYTGHTKCPTLLVIYKISEAFGISPIQFLDCDLFNTNNLDLE